MKKIISIIVLVLILLSITSCVNPEQPDPQQETYTIQLNNNSMSIEVYERYQLSATILNSKGEVVVQEITWISSNPDITVNNGVVLAKNVGTAVITAKLSDGTSATCQVTSTSNGVIPQLKLNVSDNMLSIMAGQKYTFIPNVYFNGLVANDIDTAFYYVVSDPNIATIDANGVLTANSSGSTTITVYASWRGLGGLSCIGGEDAYGLVFTINLTVMQE